MYNSVARLNISSSNFRHLVTTVSATFLVNLAIFTERNRTGPISTATFRKFLAIIISHLDKSVADKVRAEDLFTPNSVEQQDVC